MGMPMIDIIFQSAAQEAFRRTQAKSVAVIIKDAAAQAGGYVLKSKADIGALGLDSVTNTKYLERAFDGYVNQPQKVLCYVLGTDAQDLSDALAWLATQQFDYLAGPKDITADESAELKTWIDTQRGDYNAIYKAVLPNLAADSEAIVNFVTDGIKYGSSEVDAEGYCSRIAGMLAGTPMTYSCTYATLPEVSDVTRMTPSEMDAAVDAGKFLLFYDGKNVKTGRAVNSLTTLGAKSAAYKKIKIVEALDMINSDLRRLCQDYYVGKYPNSYDNKVLLMTAVKSYLTELETAGILQTGSQVGIDLNAQKEWLEENGYDTSDMTEEEMLHHDTGSSVFLAATIRVLDAIEDITITINI